MDAAMAVALAAYPMAAGEMPLTVHAERPPAVPAGGIAGPWR
jgi:hypothetical protein